MNTSCIKSIKVSYKVKSGYKSCMRGMSEYTEAERETDKEAKKETGRAEVASGSESEAGTAEEHPTQRTRHAVPSVLEPLLPKVSPAKKRQEKDLRL